MKMWLATQGCISQVAILELFIIGLAEDPIYAVSHTMMFNSSLFFK